MDELEETVGPMIDGAMCDQDRMCELVRELERNVYLHGAEAVKANEEGRKVIQEIKALHRKLEPVWLENAINSWPLQNAPAEDKQQKDRAVRAVMKDCRKEGGLRDRCIAALVEEQDLDLHGALLGTWVRRLEREAFYPIWRKHCVIMPGGFDIRNDLNGAIWRMGEDGKYMWYIEDVPFSDRFPPGDVWKVVQAHEKASDAFMDGAEKV